MTPTLQRKDETSGTTAETKGDCFVLGTLEERRSLPPPPQPSGREIPGLAEPDMKTKRVTFKGSVQ